LASIKPAEYGGDDVAGVAVRSGALLLLLTALLYIIDSHYTINERTVNVPRKKINKII
jgi:hypothetical protein